LKSSRDLKLSFEGFADHLCLLGKDQSPELDSVIWITVELFCACGFNLEAGL
jgi:hypothetical protein